MLLDFTVALDGARTLTHIDDLARSFYGANGDGRFSDADAERVEEAIGKARLRLRPAPAAPRAGQALKRASFFPPRLRRLVAPDRLRSRERRRRLAYSGPLPPALACRFTPGQLATLRIVRDECQAHGKCMRSLGEIAARAGVCVSLARGAIKLAASDGLLTSTERRRHGQPSLTNIIRVVSPEWKAWIARGNGGGGGYKKINPKENNTLIVTNSGATAIRNAGKRLTGDGGAQPQGRRPVDAPLRL